MWSEALKTGELAARTLLDEPLVFFRDATGQAVAMDDMCPHRLAPLRLGKLLPDGRIQCGYHGLEFDSAGECVKNPTAVAESRKAAGLKPIRCAKNTRWSGSGWATAHPMKA